jgi:hypothetical protein
MTDAQPKQSLAALVTDELIDEIVEIVTGWSGEDGTDYMAVTVQVREALTRSSEVCGTRFPLGGACARPNGHKSLCDRNADAEPTDEQVHND